MPAAVRRKLGLAPGSMLEWQERNGDIVVRRAGGVSFAEIHGVLFPDGPPPRRSQQQVKQAIANHIRERHGRGRY